MGAGGWVSFLAVVCLAGCTLSSEGEVGGAADGVGGPGAASTGSGGMQGSAGATGTTGGTEGGEDCTNGVDDDGNGATDCDDAACSDHACVDAVPGAAYVLVDTGSGCPTGWEATPLWDCATCGCKAPCVVEVQIFTDHLCTHLGAAIQLQPDGTCLDHADVFSEDVNITKVGVRGTLASGATTCALAGPAPWALCAPMTGACADGKACIPPGGPPTCVLTDAGECPADWNASNLLLHPGPDGSACGCACTGRGACPTEMTHFLDENDCGGHSHDRALDGTCFDTTDSAVRSSRAIPSGARGCEVTSTPTSAPKLLCCK